jgi:hypothetical protein
MGIVSHKVVSLDDQESVQLTTMQSKSQGLFFVLSIKLGFCLSIIRTYLR